MKTEDPARLAKDKDSPALGELLAAAQQDVLDEEARARVWSALGAAGATAAAASAASGTKAGSAGISALAGAKGLVGIALLIGAAGLGSALWYAHQPTKPSGVASPALIHSHPWVQSPPTPSEEPPTVLPPDPAPPPSAQELAVVSAQRSKTVPSSAAPLQSAAPDPSPREGLLLLRARQALNTSPSQALDLARQHEREFPNSQLAPERSRIVQDALSRINREK